MLIDQKIVPYLIKLVEYEIQQGRQELEQDLPEFSLSAFSNPNDLTILHSSVLPLLRDSLDEGFEVEDMLDKGWGFVCGMLPRLLATTEFNGTFIPDEVRGKLARIFWDHWIDTMKDTYDSFEDKDLPANFDRILFYARALDFKKK